MNYFMSRDRLAHAGLGMGREGFEPSTLGLRVGAGGLCVSRVVSRLPSQKRDLGPTGARSSRVVSLPVSFPPCSHPGGVMNGPPQPPATHDPTLRALVERGLPQAQAREAAATAVEPPAGRLPAAPRVVPRRGRSAWRLTGPAWRPASLGGACGAPPPRRESEAASWCACSTPPTNLRWGRGSTPDHRWARSPSTWSSGSARAGESGARSSCATSR